MTISPPSPLERLRLADPDAFKWVLQRLNTSKVPASQQVLTWLADETIWALTLERGLALALADAIIELAAHAAESAIPALIDLVHEATATGVTLASIVAAHTGPVLRAGPVLLSKFQTLLPVMLAKGTYTLKPPLILLSELLASAQTEAADAFIDLLITIFRQPMSYNQSLGLVYQVPQAVRHFPSERRAAQLRQFRRIVECGLNLVTPFLEGMQKGLELLPQQSLAAFLDQVLSRCRPDSVAAASCLSLQSRLGLEIYAPLQTAASLTHVRPSLNRYLGARLGSPLSIKSLADLNASGKDPRTWVCSDGQAIFARDEIRCHDSASRNADLYLTLMRIEAGFYECRSFSFDLERAAVRYPVVRQWLQRHGVKDTQQPGGDARLFFESFSEPRLAEDLFMIVELGRVSQCMHQRYPGMRRRTAAHLDDEIRRLIESGAWRHPLAGAYLRLVAGSVHPMVPNPDDWFTAGLHQLFMDTIDAQSPVEACAPILCRTFDRIWSAIRTKSAGYTDFAFPFHIRLRWDLIQAAMTIHKRQVDEIHGRLSEKGLSAYQADLRYHLLKGQGRITVREMKELIADKARDDAAHADGIHLLGRSADAQIADAQIEALLNPDAAADQVAPDDKAEAFFYPEWDYRLQDYLQAHTRIHEAELPGEHSESFYQQSLERYAGLVAHMRRAFERLRPEGWAMLRQWPDGDAFDYRALLDYAVDRRTGHIPSDRLYIKRLKQERDVAVLVLVDLSRSTANPVIGRQCSVLDLTKEALVLFCESLEVVGDQYALAGFSGTGRHQVDYYPIKQFQDTLNQAIRHRISALHPQRSTRMGAAIRHGARNLAQAAARIRLMIIISDGFPNDLGYKAEYAIHDTRKAVQEARYLGLFVKAVTVSIGQNPKLEELYGQAHSHVIEDVATLPGKLLRLYGNLTRPY